MPTKEMLIDEIEALPSFIVDEIYDYVAFIKAKRIRDIPDTMLLSETALAKDWLRPEEEEAWADL